MRYALSLLGGLVMMAAFLDQSYADPANSRVCPPTKALFTQNGSNANATRISAEAGDARAQYTLGEMYSDGKIIPQNYGQAFYWYEMAARQGYPDAQLALAIHLASGISVSQDRVRADGLFRTAFSSFKDLAERGDVKAQFRLATMYKLGQGVPVDTRKAIEWYSKVSEAGYSEASARIAEIYYHGLSNNEIPVDYQQAVLWLQKAVEQSTAPTFNEKLMLSHIYAKTLPIMQPNNLPPDYIRAYMWCDLSGGNLPCDSIASNMTAVQISEAKRMAEEWQHQHPCS